MGHSNPVRLGNRTYRGAQMSFYFGSCKKKVQRVKNLFEKEKPTQKLMFMLNH